jgi:hypothetical protein
MPKIKQEPTTPQFTISRWILGHYINSIRNPPTWFTGITLCPLIPLVVPLADWEEIPPSLLLPSPAAPARRLTSAVACLSTASNRLPLALTQTRKRASNPTRFERQARHPFD